MITFGDIYAKQEHAAHTPARHRASGECETAARKRCTLCHASHLTYEDEARLKESALREFWSQHYPAAPLRALVLSPMGRWYRTVSKRKAFPGRDGLTLGLIQPRGSDKNRPLPVVRCAIEPAEHAAIYSGSDALLRQPGMRPLAEQLRYIIIKGNYHEQTLILNVGLLESRLRHAANAFSKRLTKRFPGITGIFLFEDGSDGRYYLGSDTPNKAPVFQKVYGKPSVFLKICGKSFLFHPLAFSQVNASMIDTMVQQVKALLPGNRDATLFDLYCGYGLFSLSLADAWKRVIGAELSHDAIHSARENATRQHTSNATFLRNPITGESVQRIMAPGSPADAVILDPPRNGTEPGVIESIATRQPRQVLHLFCNIDLLPSELQRWKDGGYGITTAVPLDNFPGTGDVEMIVRLEPLKP